MEPTETGALRLLAEFGKTISVLRKRQGLSQEAFAEKVGVHRTYMGAIERGEQNVAFKNLYRIATALEVPLSTLLLRAEERWENS